MREQFNEKQDLLTEVGLQTYRVCRDESSFETEDGTRYEYDTFTVSGVTRNELISSLVSQEYPFNREIREIRKAVAFLTSKYEDAELDSFKAYNAFVEGVSSDLK